MNDAFGVRGVDRVGNFDSQRQCRFDLHWLSANAMLQRESVQKFHGDESFAVCVINLVDGADVRMIQRRGGPGFALKAAECLRVFGYVVGQELEGHNRRSLTSSALYTTPIPPPPIFSTMR